MRVVSIVALIAALGAVTPSAATTLRVSPVLIDLVGGQRAASLTLTNADTRPASVQVRVFRWTQVDGADRLEPSRDVVVSPPATRLEAGAQHLIRVVRTAAAPPRAEESYRVLVDEIPDATTPRQNGVAFVLRQSLPVFFNAGSSGRSAVSWRLARAESGWTLVARNAGARRLRISELEIRDGRGAVLERKAGLLGYVLSGAEMRWPLQSDLSASKATLTAMTDAGPLRVDLAPPPR